MTKAGTIAERRATPWRWVALTLLAASAAWFVWRGPMRLLNGGYDLAVILASAGAWLDGGNPYDLADAEAAYARRGGPEAAAPGTRGAYDLLYPPTTFALLAPVAMLDWQGARLAWLALNVLATAAAIASIVRLCGWGRRDPRTIVFAAWALAFGAVHTTFMAGQTALLAAAMVAMGQAARSAGRHSLAGVLLGLATALKPQVGGIFVAFEAVQARWRSAAAAAGTVVLAAGIGIGRLELGDQDWLPALRGNVREFSLHRQGDPTTANPYRHQMVNLHPPLHEWTDDRAVVAAIVWGFVGACGVAYLAVRRGKHDRADLASLTLAAVGTLLVVYHRYYDAAILLFGVALVVDRAGATHRRPAWAVWLAGACVLVLSVPGPAALASVAATGRLPASITDSAVWRGFILPHQPWTLVLLGIATLALVAGGERSASPSSSTSTSSPPGPR